MTLHDDILYIRSQQRTPLFVRTYHPDHNSGFQLTGFNISWAFLLFTLLLGLDSSGLTPFIFSLSIFMQIHTTWRGLTEEERMEMERAQRD